MTGWRRWTLIPSLNDVFISFILRTRAHSDLKWTAHSQQSRRVLSRVEAITTSASSSSSLSWYTCGFENAGLNLCLKTTQVFWSNLFADFLRFSRSYRVLKWLNCFSLRRFITGFLCSSFNSNGFQIWRQIWMIFTTYCVVGFWNLYVRWRIALGLC